MPANRSIARTTTEISTTGHIALDPALEHSGAHRGLLILLRSGTPQIEAEASIDRKTVEVRLRQGPITPNDLPESLLHTVIRTRESVILGDASAPNPFSVDAYIRESHARSVLSLPLVKQATLIGVLYLENNLASHVFTPARISVLELLSSQAGDLAGECAALCGPARGKPRPEACRGSAARCAGGARPRGAAHDHGRAHGFDCP